MYANRFPPASTPKNDAAPPEPLSNTEDPADLAEIAQIKGAEIDRRSRHLDRRLIEQLVEFEIGRRR